MGRDIKKVALIGANGTMGYGSGALFTSAGCDVTFLARTLEKANAGLSAAQKQVRSPSVASLVTTGNYHEDLAGAVSEADIIFEAVVEDFETKRQFFEKVDQYRKPDSIVATVSSGLSIEKLAESRSESFQKHFLGLHYFNPPNVIVGTELIPGTKTDPEIVRFLMNWCTKNQQRTMIQAKDRPGFAGNRVGFKVLNEAAQLAEKYNPLYIDSLVGPYTGRALPPLATIDLVGWDVHKAIVDNVVTHVSRKEDEALDTYHLPGYMKKMIAKGTLGNKSGGGFYKRVEKQKYCLDISSGQYKLVAEMKPPNPAFLQEMKMLHSIGQYQKAMQIFAAAEGEEAEVAQKIIGGYISYSFHRVGEITDDITEIDMIMGTGFNWAPPSVLVDFIGLEATIAMLEKVQLPVPEILSTAASNKRNEPFFQHPTLNQGKFFIAK